MYCSRKENYDRGRHRTMPWSQHSFAFGYGGRLTAHVRVKGTGIFGGAKNRTLHGFFKNKHGRQEMINAGKCPKCERTITNVKIETVSVSVGFTPEWEGISYVCPFCSAILSVQIDPIALKTDIIDGVVKELKGYMP